MLRPRSLCHCVQQTGTEGGLNKALQLTIERNGPCDPTMNGTLSIAKLALAERMHGFGCPCTTKAAGRLAREGNTERKKQRPKKQYKLTHWTRNSLSGNRAKH